MQSKFWLQENKLKMPSSFDVHADYAAGPFGQ
jgi:hypothetical protein